MHNGQLSHDERGVVEHKYSQEQFDALMALPSARHSISPRAFATEITTCTEAGSELMVLSQDLYRLLATESPNIARIPEILTRRLSSLFPFASGEGMLAKIQAATEQLMTFGVNPALVLHGAQKAMGAGVRKIEPGKQVLVNAIHSAGGEASAALDLYHACTGLYSLYNTYTELNRLYASMQFCSARAYTSAQELAELTGSDEQWKMLNEAFSEYWNQPGFDFKAFINQTAEQLQVILAPIQGLIVLYETIEPVRISTYLAITMRIEPNAASQLDQVAYLLTNACYNTALKNIGTVSKSAGDLLGRTLPGVAINAGTSAALTACATAVTGMSFPITIAILATCMTDSNKRDALIAYAKSRIITPSDPQIGEQKSDTGVQATVLKQLEALKNRGNTLLNPLAAKISPTINTLVNGCFDASGAIVGDMAENAIRTLIQDSGLEPLLKEQMDSIIYQVLDETLRQTLQIPEEKVFSERLQGMNGTEAAVYQTCGALIPDMVNLLAIPNLVEAQLQAVTGDPHICSEAGKPLNLKEKTLQAATRAVSTVVQANVGATLSMIQAGKALKTAIQGSEAPPALPSPTVLETVRGYAKQVHGHIAGQAAALPLSALGSTANRELATGLRIHLIEEGTPEESIPAPAIVFSRKTTSRLGGLMSSESIEIKSFKIAKKTGELATALTSVGIGRTRIVRMEDLEKENAELKIQSEAVVQQNASRTNPISSVLLPLDHPLVQLITGQLQHASRRFNYVEQNDKQQATLVVQRQRAIDNERIKQQAIELAKIKEAAAASGFGEAFFEDFNTTPVIQERYTRLLDVINGVDTLPINLASDDAIKVRQYIKARLTHESEILLSHINAATERFNALKLNDFSIKDRLAEIKKDIRDVDNIGWFGTTWFAPTVASEARTHYLALLELQQRELEATIVSLEQPLKDLTAGHYAPVTAYVMENPAKADLLLSEVSLYEKTFWSWQRHPADLVKLKELLSDIVAQNRPAEGMPNVVMHLPAEPAVPAVPALTFGGIAKLNKPESKDDEPDNAPVLPPKTSPKAKKDGMN